MEFQYFPAELDSLSLMLLYIRISLPEDLFVRLELAAEEILVNIIQHAYEGKKGAIGISFLDGTQVVIQDSGIFFNPLLKRSSPCIEKGEGCGLKLVAHSVPKATYQRVEEKNYFYLTI